MIAFLLLSTLTSMAGDTLQTKSGLRYLVLKEGSGEQTGGNA